MRKVFFDAETIDMEDAGEIDVKNTRSMMREGGEIYWNANDMLGVFTQNGSPQKFKTANGGKVTRFEGYNDVEGEFYVLYPFNEGARLEGNIISTELSAVQYPEPGSFYNGGNILLAKTRQGETAFFHNVCTWVRISISEDYAGTITGMVLEGNNGELLAGDVTIDTTLGNDARITVCDSEKASKKIVMNTEDHFYQGKYYYFILPPQTFEKGVTVTFVNKDGLTWKRVITSPATLEPGKSISISNVMPGTFEYGEDFELENCFYVHTLDGLYEWAERVNNGEYDLDCQLMASFDFDKDPENRKWIPVGMKEHPYEGVFNGNGRELRHLRVDGEYECAGFFGALGPVRGREDKNVKVSNTNLSIRLSAVLIQERKTIQMMMVTSELLSV